MEAHFLSIGMKRVFSFFRLFGLAVGLVSTAYFTFTFWLIFHGITVSFFETNIAVASLELFMAVIGFVALFAILLIEVVKWH